MYGTKRISPMQKQEWNSEQWRTSIRKQRQDINAGISWHPSPAAASVISAMSENLLNASVTLCQAAPSTPAVLAQVLAAVCSENIDGNHKTPPAVKRVTHKNA